jgi:hypothetical protein
MPGVDRLVELEDRLRPIDSELEQEARLGRDFGLLEAVVVEPVGVAPLHERAGAWRMNSSSWSLKRKAKSAKNAV